jgi:hypothetical protein
VSSFKTILVISGNLQLQKLKVHSFQNDLIGQAGPIPLTPRPYATLLLLMLQSLQELISEAIGNVDELLCTWEEFEYYIDVCRVTEVA